MSDPVKKEQIDWVRAVMAHLGLTSANQLAERAGINPANIQRPLSENFKGKFGVNTIAAIARAANLRPMEFPNPGIGFPETEAVPFVYGEHSDAIASNIDRAVRELTRGRNGRDAWVIKSRAVQASGFLPGDIAIVDLNLSPAAQDVVCAQIYNWSSMRSETVFRVYQPPYLMTNSLRFDGVDKPLLVDGQNIVIKGVVDGMVRARRAA